MPQCIHVSVLVCVAGRRDVTDVEQVVKWGCCGAAPTGAPRLFTVHLNRQPEIFIATATQPAHYFKLTFIKTKYSGGSLTANLGAVVLSHYLPYLVFVNGSVETTVTSLPVEFIEISVIKFLCSAETQLQLVLIVRCLLTSVPSLCFKCKQTDFHCPCWSLKHFF